MGSSLAAASGTAFPPGTVCLTNRRLPVFRREPPPCSGALRLARSGARGWIWSRDRRIAPRVHIAMRDGHVEQIAAQGPDRLAKLLARHAGRNTGEGSQDDAQG